MRTFERAISMLAVLDTAIATAKNVQGVTSVENDMQLQ